MTVIDNVETRPITTSVDPEAPKNNREVYQARLKDTNEKLQNLSITSEARAALEVDKEFYEHLIKTEPTTDEMRQNLAEHSLTS